MSTEMSYSEARQHLAALLDRAINDRETVFIKRRNGSKAALLDAQELAGFEETAHLLKSPANAKRLLDGLRESLDEDVEVFDFADLRRRLDDLLPPSRGTK
jgi:antitoxin YefM